MTQQANVSRVPRLIPYYGAKHSIAKKYPPPEYDTIIEPFAGSAGYSSIYPDKEVILIDKDPIIAGIWEWLISATKEEILELPLIQPGELVKDLDTHERAKWLIGFWCNDPAHHPMEQLVRRSARLVNYYYETGSWEPPGRKGSQKFTVWHEPVRERISDAVSNICHWGVGGVGYQDAPDVCATWFIDPPYQEQGKHYRYNEIDYDKLADFCLSRKGQIIVCESEGANWLPFTPLTSYNGQSKPTTEMIYTENSPSWNPPIQPFNPSTQSIIDYLRD